LGKSIGEQKHLHIFFFISLRSHAVAVWAMWQCGTQQNVIFSATLEDGRSACNELNAFSVSPTPEKGLTPKSALPVEPSTRSLDAAVSCKREDDEAALAMSSTVGGSASGGSRKRRRLEAKEDSGPGRVRARVFRPAESETESEPDI
jgi:hypothetical protein